MNDSLTYDLNDLFFAVSDEEKHSCLMFIRTRLRTMAKHGHNDAIFLFKNMPWRSTDIKAAIKYLSDSGLKITEKDVSENPAFCVYWGHLNEA